MLGKLVRWWKARKRRKALAKLDAIVAPYEETFYKAALEKPMPSLEAMLHEQIAENEAHHRRMEAETSEKLRQTEAELGVLVTMMRGMAYNHPDALRAIEDQAFRHTIGWRHLNAMRMAYTALRSGRLEDVKEAMRQIRDVVPEVEKSSAPQPSTQFG